MDDAAEFLAELLHDGTVKTVMLPRTARDEPPPHVRVAAVDAAGNPLIDVFLLSDTSGWPARAGYRYAGSIPIRS